MSALTGHITLLGLLVPYGVPSRTPIDGGKFRTAIHKGSFSETTLSRANQVSVCLDHSPIRLPSRVGFVNLHSGLYATIMLPNGPLATWMMSLEPQWRGLSIGYGGLVSSQTMNLDHAIKHVWDIETIDHVAIVTGKNRPAFAETWLAPCSPDAMTRAKNESALALMRGWHATDVKKGLPDSTTAAASLPQSRDLEAALVAIDPEQKWTYGADVTDWRWLEVAASMGWSPRPASQETNHAA